MKLSDRAIAHLSSKALIHNYKTIARLAPKHRLLPMLKANAYGHDAAWAGRTLLGQPRLAGYGVATLEEGAELRKALGAQGRKLPLMVFSGASLWSDEKGRFCLKHGLTPVLSHRDDWRAFYKKGWAKKLDYQLKFNTGMNRLGFSMEDAADIIRDLVGKPADLLPQGVLSHLAMSDDPLNPLSIRQKDEFSFIRSEFRRLSPKIEFHLGNSGAIWSRAGWQLDEISDIVRPGISLYGIRPWPLAPTHDIKPVMTITAQVLQVRHLAPGEALGYDALFMVDDNAPPKTVAILSLGYADGLHRALTNRGQVWLKGGLRQVLGAISMDMVAVECPPETRTGDSAEILGPQIEPWEQAERAGTIPYEL